MRLKNYIYVLIIAMAISGCSSKKYKNISYLQPTTATTDEPSLNIFSPRKTTLKTPVLIFVHGGNWNSGDKKMYGFVGRNFAKKGITTVIVGYTLSPKTDFDGMAKQVAKAVEWTKENISKYNGNPEKIYLTGHSAGGHLIALVGTNTKYLKDKSIIKGIILNDAAGLDMKHYLQEIPPTEKDSYLKTWSNSPEIWKNASPIYFLDKNAPPFMIYTGGTKTYRSIQIANERFLKELHQYQPNVKLNVLNKNHVSMITQYFFPWSNRYDEIINFINSPKL